ncbi:hypothetical protein AVEN_136523-1 [Araneus ventricosus]|uniref:Uncharacterized protein n=1 Tax=Araneus ventricosus TaxID=182803 RepID=A0A4Y2KNJ8_ARAVE|nr:hypothetical protein AVEN_136523-1 [Araneus ventricosus]
MVGRNRRPRDYQSKCERHTHAQSFGTIVVGYVLDLRRGHDGLVGSSHPRGSRVPVSKPDSIEVRHAHEPGAHEISCRGPNVLLLVWSEILEGDAIFII